MDAKEGSSDSAAVFGTARRRVIPSHSAENITARLRAGTLGPVLSLRTWLMNCKSADLETVFQALLTCESVHMLSIGRNDALGSSLYLAEMLVQVLRQGFIWACDWGELCPRPEVMDLIMDGLSDASGRPCTNLAFVFADVGCGVSADNIARLKDITRERRLLDKATPPEQVSRTSASWLQVDRVFGWVMQSENITRCFWRPYQEAEFWRRGEFSCKVVKKPSSTRTQDLRRWVSPSVQLLSSQFHRGMLSADEVEKAFPPGDLGLDLSRALLATSLEASRQNPALLKSEEQGGEGTPPMPEGGETPPLEPGTPPLEPGNGTPLPEPRSPSPESEDDGKDEDWKPGQASRDKKRRRKDPPGSAPISAPKAADTGASAPTMAEGSGAAAKSGKRSNKKEQAPVAMPSLLEVAKVKAAPPASAVAKDAPATVDALTPARRKAPVGRRAEQAPADMVGIWSYGENLTYEINMFYDKLFYQEFNPDGSLFCQGELASHGKHLIAMLRSNSRVHVGTIRLLHEAQAVISNFKDVGSEEWQNDTVARKQQASSHPDLAVSSRPASAAEPLLEGALGVMHPNAGLPGARHFVLHCDRLDCYKSTESVKDGLQPLESFWTDQLQDLKDGSEKKSVAGDSIRIFFIDASYAKSLVAAIKKARSAPASTAKSSPAAAAGVKCGGIVKSKAKAKARKRAW